MLDQSFWRLNKNILYLIEMTNFIELVNLYTVIGVAGVHVFSSSQAKVRK